MSEEPTPELAPQSGLPVWPGPYAPLPLVAHLYAPWTSSKACRGNRSRNGSVGKSCVVDCLEAVGDRLVIAPARPLAAFGWLGGLLRRNGRPRAFARLGLSWTLGRPWAAGAERKNGLKRQ